MKLTKEQLQLLVDSSPEPTVIYLIKKDQSALVPFLYSKDVPAFSGLTEEEYLALYKEGAEKVVVPQDLSSVMNTIRQLFMDKNPGFCTYRTYHKTKGPIWTHASFKWIGEYEDQEVIFGAFTDVSNQVAENTPGGFFIYAAEEDDQFYFVSENMLKMLGYTRDEFQTKFKNQFRYLVYQEDREAALQSIDEQIIENGQYDNVDYRIEN
jgi:PAS domain-containing protein